MRVTDVTITEISTVILHGAGYGCENDKMVSLLQNYTGWLTQHKLFSWSLQASQ